MFRWDGKDSGQFMVGRLGSGFEGGGKMKGGPPCPSRGITYADLGGEECKGMMMSHEQAYHSDSGKPVSSLQWNCLRLDGR